MPDKRNLKIKFMIKAFALSLCAMVYVLGFTKQAYAYAISLENPVSSCLVSQRSVSLTWSSDINGNTTYQVLRKLSFEEVYQNAGITDNLSFIDNNILSGVFYNYKIKAVKDGIEIYSNEAASEAFYCAAVFSIPVSVCNADGPSNELSWSAISGAVSRYEVYKKNITTGDVDYSKIAETENLHYSDKASVAGTNLYEYYIKSIWVDGTEKDSIAYPIEAQTCPPIANLSSECNGSAPGGQRINLSWNKYLGVERYEVYRKAQSEADFILLSSLNGSLNSYQDNLTESLPLSYWMQGNISYFIKAIWIKDLEEISKDSMEKSILNYHCNPFVTTSAMCDVYDNPEIHVNWTKTMNSDLHNLYRDTSYFLGQIGGDSVSFVDYLNPDNCPGKICGHSYKIESSVVGYPNFVSNNTSQNIDCATIVPPSPAPLLESPVNFCENGKTKVKLRWSSSNNAIYYSLYRNGETLLNLTNNTYIDSGVESGNNYIYSVVAFGKGGTRVPEGAPATTMVSVLSCAAPNKANLVLSKSCDFGTSKVNLSWSSTNNTENYELKKGTSATNLSTKAVVDRFTNSWNDIDEVIPSTTYYYQVVSNGILGVSPSYSSIQSIMSDSCLPYTPQVSLGEYCDTGAPKVKVSWTTNNNNTQYYEIYRKDVETVPIKTIYQNGGNSYSWIDNTVSQALPYRYKVVAVGYSPLQKTTQGYKIVNTNNCSFPGNFTLTNPPMFYCQGSYLMSNLSWTSSSNSTSYDVFRNKLDVDNNIIGTSVFYGKSSIYTDKGFGKSLNFTGDDYVNFGNSGDNLTGNLSIEFWAKPVDISAGRQNPLCKSYGAEFCLTMETNGSLTYYHGSAGINSNPYTSFSMANVFKNNEWTHVVITRNIATKTIKSYINGNYQALKTWTNLYNPVLSDYSLMAGKGYVSNFKGMMDEIRIYNRVLSESEARDHFKGVYDNENGLVRLWHFDEGSGQVASDSSSFGFNGTLGSVAGVDVYDPSWVVDGIDYQSKYSWQVRANGPGGSVLSNLTSPISFPVCQPTKTSLKLVATCGGVNKSSIDLKWSYAINTDKYEIYRDGELIKTIISADAEFMNRIWRDDNNGIGLNKNKAYSYQVKSIGFMGYENQSSIESAVTSSCNVPVKPKNVLASFQCAGANNSFPKIELSWSASEGATGYSIYRNGLLLKNIISTNYTDSYPSVAVNTQYSYYVIANSLVGNSLSSDVAIVGNGQYCDASIPAVNSISTNCGTNFPVNNISWFDSSTFNTLKYEIYRDNKTNLVKTISNGEAGFSSKTWEDASGLNNSTNYDYWIKAVGYNGNSSLFSSKGSIDTLVCGTILEGPSLSYNTFCSNNKPLVTLDWTNVADANSYNLYRVNATDSINSSYPSVHAPITDIGNRVVGFNGVKNYVNMGDPNSLKIISDLAVSAWVNSDVLQTSYARILAKGSYPEDYDIELDGNGDRLCFYVGISNAKYGVCTPDGGIQGGVWHHVVGIRKGNEIAIYLDGSLSMSRSDIPNSFLDANSGDFHIGNQGASNNFKGKIDEVRVYARALSSEEIMDNFSNLYKNEAELRGVWHFDERLGATINDSSGYNNNGKIAGPEWNEGRYGYGAEMTGMDGYIQVMNSSSLNTGSKVSIEAWVKPKSVNDCDWIVGKKEGNWASKGYALQMCNSNNLRLLGSGGIIATSTSWVWDNNWHHIVGVINGSTGKIYKDGVEVTLSSSVSPLISSTANLKIGNRENAAYFNGIVDDVKIYNRDLTSIEIAEHYSGLYKDESGLVESLHFDEAFGSMSFDNSGNNNNAIFVTGAVKDYDASFPYLSYPLERNKAYRYSVKAVSVGNEGNASNSISFIAPSCLPVKPNLTLTPGCDASGTQIQIAWSPDPNTSYWSVYKKRSSQPESSYVCETCPGITANSYIDYNIESDTSYDYYAVAYGNGVNTYSDVKSAVASICYDVPVKPTITTDSQCAGTSSRIAVNWDPYNDSKTFTYNMHRKNITDGEMDYSLLAQNIPYTARRYVDGNVEIEKNYAYKLEAVGFGSGNSVSSDELPASLTTTLDCISTPPFYPPFLSFVSASYKLDSLGEVKLKWNDTQNEKSYEIFRRLQGETQFAYVGGEESGSGWQDAFLNKAVAAYTSPVGVVIAGTDYVDPAPTGFVAFNDTTVSEDVTYEYQIRAINDAGITSSNIISPVYVPIAPPGDLTLSYQYMPGNIKLKWTAAAYSVKGGPPNYTVYRDDSANFDSPVAICSNVSDFPVDSNNRTCNDNNPLSGISFYVARAENNSPAYTESNHITVLGALKWDETTP